LTIVSHDSPRPEDQNVGQFEVIFRCLGKPLDQILQVVGKIPHCASRKRGEQTVKVRLERIAEAIKRIERIVLEQDPLPNGLDREITALAAEHEERIGCGNGVTAAIQLPSA
jgi:hypothetical protein